MEVVGYLLAFIVGLVMGLIGAGGSILSSGLMIYIFGLNPMISASYTLLNVGIISLVGSIQYYRKDLVQIRTGLLFAAPAIVTVLYMRAYVVPSIPHIIFESGSMAFSKDLFVKLVFAILMIIIAWNMITKKTVETQKANNLNAWMVTLIGIIVGLLTGIVGVGGGFMIVPALLFFTGLNVKTAVGTSLFIITLNTGVGFFGDFAAGVVYNWAFLIKFISLTVLGMLISGLVVHKVQTEKIKKLFAIVMLFLGTWIIFKELWFDCKRVNETIIESSSPGLEPHRIFYRFD